MSLNFTFLGAKAPLELAHVKKKWNEKFWNSMTLLLCHEVTLDIACKYSLSILILGAKAPLELAHVKKRGGMEKF